ncbi:methyltransferase domain-containing protein [Idiomarina seosinensis]|uniref:methyltransferase domain-containing protein n=1 Tax=Idiomarina seosinensis TaxID=281739 RepID=UPI00384B2D45
MAAEQQQVARHFSRAAVNYHQHDAIQQYFGRQLLSYLPQPVDQLIDIGCGPGSLRPLLGKHCRNYLGIDLAAGMVRQAKQNFPDDIWLQACAEQLPLQNDSVDAYFANLSLQWSPSLHSVFSEALRILKPGARAVFNLPVAGTLSELSSCWRKIDERPHIRRFHSLTEVLTCLEGIGISHYQHRLDEQQQYFPDLRSLLASIKGVGASYVGPRQAAGLLSPRRFQRVVSSYEKYRQEKGLPLNWKVLSVCFEKQVN